MTLIAFSLLLFQLQAKDPGLEAGALDNAIKGISGFNGAKALPPIGDEAFLNRVMKDLVDATPTEVETKTFAADPDSKKRAKMIDQLAGDPRFANSWAKRFERVFFGDDVRKEPWKEAPGLSAGRQGQAVENFTQWLAARLKRDTPWTEIVFQMIDARGTLEGDPSLAWLMSMRRGKGFPLELAERLPRELLGIRLRCARCHDHITAWRHSLSDSARGWSETSSR
jgi:hypothetical protein